MDPWTIGLVALLAAGFALILYGFLHDRAKNRRAREEMLSPPKRDIPRFRPDAPAPHYLSELQARRPPPDAASTDLSAYEREALVTRLRASGVVSIPVGFAAKTFVTDPPSGWAVLDDPVVLLAGGEISSIRELLPVLERAAMSARALVIAAPSFADDVLSTLEVNVVQRKLRLLALVVDDTARALVAEHTGATPLGHGDLQAGYVPADQLGSVGRWVSDRQRSWLLPPAPEAADSQRPSTAGTEANAE